MKKSIIKVFSVILVVVLTLTSAPLSGFVGLELPEWLDFSIMSKASTTSGSCGSNLTWTYNTSKFLLTISGTGKMYDYYFYKNYPWKEYEDSIKTVIIGNGATTIGDYAFYNCESLTSVTIPNSVTTIGDSAFEGCKSLTNLEIGDGVTIFGEDAFDSCNSLENLTIGKSVTEVRWDTFRYCDSLKNVYYTGSLAEWCENEFTSSDLHPLYYADNLYISGELLQGDIVIPNGVTSIGDYAFYNCDNFTSIIIPDSVMSIGEGAFISCDYLKTVNILDILAWCNITFNNSSSNPLNKGADLYLNGEKISDLVIPDDVTRLNDYAFVGCTSLTSVTISDSVTSVGSYAFENCISLTNVTIGDGVTSIGSYTFENCTSLTSVTIGDSVTSIGAGVFNKCNSLEVINVDTNNGAYCSNDGILFNKDKTSIICYPAGKTATSYTIPDGLTVIGDNAFYSCTSLTSIIIPDSITTIGNYAFEGCTSLTSIVIPDNVTTIGNYTFEGCTSLTSIVIPDSVITIGEWSFYGCTSLTSVTIPDSVISIGYSAFRDCYSLTNVTIGSCVKTISSFAFNYCTSLTNVTIPDSVTTIGDAAFENCDSITSITIPDGVTGIYSFAFAECDLLTTVIIPDSVTSIGWHAFSRCTSLTSITIPDSVKTIDTHAFYNCTSLTSIAIGNNVTKIYYYAFDGCISLTDVYYSGTASQWNAISIDEWCNESLLNATIHFCEIKEKEPTCITSGYIKYTCSSCGDTFTNYLAAKEHKAGEWEITIEPACTKVGTKIQKCIICNKIIKTEEIPATGHNYTTTVILPTCTAMGYTTYTCSCGHSYVNDYVEAIGHSYDDGVLTLEPTCIDTGIKVFTCAVCDDTYNEDVEVVGHDIITDEAVAPDCTNTGLTTGEHCSRCDYKVEQTVVDALGHKYESLVTAPTCTSQGYTTYNCSVCGDTYTSDFVEALGHIDGDIVEENYVAPTCTETGSKDNVTYCTVCNAETSRKEMMIDATGHTEEEIPAVAPTCTETGLTAGVKCSVCDEILTAQQELPANGHKYESVVTAPTCTEQGFTTYTCACGDSYVDDYTDSLGHDFKNGICTECDAKDSDYFTFEIQNPSRTTIRCNDGIKLHTSVTGNLPEGSRIEWSKNNSNFNVNVSDSGNEITIISKNNGYTTFTATVYDANNKVIAEDTIEMYSKASFFDKIGGFFRSLFGTTKIYEN